MSQTTDVVIIGAGAAGLMCALTAAYRGRRVRLIDHANKPGKKILMSGGGRCNFTHLDTEPSHFLSANPHFCISALKRYTPQHFLELVERHDVAYVEKTPGQLFCRDSSKDILNILLQECEWAGVTIALNTSIDDVVLRSEGVRLQTSSGVVDAGALVVATGGLSIPTMGATGFGYELARQFGLPVLDTRAGLVPFTVTPQLRERCVALAGLSCEVEVSCNGHSFREPLLFTHRGLSGPALLQISNYWVPGKPLQINWLPHIDATTYLQDLRASDPRQTLSQALARHLPKRLAAALPEWHDWQGPLQDYSNHTLEVAGDRLNRFSLVPAGTEGYRTAEVTLGGIDTHALSSKTFAVNDIPQLFFIGEVLDVTGQLGGYNFQWAWASGHAAGSAL
jgi:predicted Rossmann fold flavoprotein